MASSVISPSISVNGSPIGIVLDSFKYTEEQEGLYFGEMITYSTLSFKMLNTADNIDLIRKWKSKLDNNSIKMCDVNSTLTRIFTNAYISNTYEVKLSSTGDIYLEWKSNAAK